MIDLLNLQRPLVIFDLETTGINVKEDRVIELAALTIYPNGVEEDYSTLVNPEMPIPLGASKVNGISDEDVKDAPTFKELSEELFELFYNVDLAGYNCEKFDIPLLQNEFYRAGTAIILATSNVVDAMNIFKYYEKHRLQDAVRFYCGHEIKDAHEALGDVYATREVIHAQLKRYNLPRDVSAISSSLQPRGCIDKGGKLKMVNDVPCLTFGKHVGMPINKLPLDYLHWLIREKVIPDCNAVIQGAIQGHQKLSLRHTKSRTE
jgi:DNA polymerase-3 subunit epsilon